jgi:hypothetical protein
MTFPVALRLISRFAISQTFFMLGRRHYLVRDRALRVLRTVSQLEEVRCGTNLLGARIIPNGPADVAAFTYPAPFGYGDASLLRGESARGAI